METEEMTVTVKVDEHEIRDAVCVAQIEKRLREAFVTSGNEPVGIQAHELGPLLRALQPSHEDSEPETTPHSVPSDESRAEEHRRTLKMLDRILCDRGPDTALIVTSTYDSARNALFSLGDMAISRKMSVSRVSHNTLDIDGCRFYATCGFDRARGRMQHGRRYVLPYDEDLIKRAIWKQWKDRSDPVSEWIDSESMENDR